MKNQSELLDDMARTRDVFDKNSEHYQFLDALLTDVNGIFIEKRSIEKKLEASQELLKSKYSDLYRDALKEHIDFILKDFKKSATKTTVITIVISAAITLFFGILQEREIINKSSLAVGNVGVQLEQYVRSINTRVSTDRSIYKESINFFTMHNIRKLEKKYVSLLYKVYFLSYDPAIERDLFIYAINKLSKDSNVPLVIDAKDLIKWEIEYLEMMRRYEDYFKANALNADMLTVNLLEYDKFKSTNDDTEYSGYGPIFTERPYGTHSQIAKYISTIIHSLEIKNNTFFNN